MNEILGVAIAAIIAWLNFVIVDAFMGLPEVPSIKGAELVGRSIKKRGGDLSGGFSKEIYFVLLMHLQVHYLLLLV